MDYLSTIKAPIAPEMNLFAERFEHALSRTDGLLSQALGYIVRRSGKRMRPILLLLVAKNYGVPTDASYHAAVGMEMLHTASLVHDDVVDDSGERRGQASVNAIYDNKISVLVGDYLLSTSLLSVALTGEIEIVKKVAQLGQTLVSGEILQLSNTQSNAFSEEVYYDIIHRKTATLFEACCSLGALSVGATPQQVEQAQAFGSDIGMIFQIRDDIFDYYPAADIGKPTGNDMAEGKLTLPLLYALNNNDDDSIRQLARKAKSGAATADEIAALVSYAKEHGGIDYAEQRMDHYRRHAQQYIDTCVTDTDIRHALQAYLDYVIRREK